MNKEQIQQIIVNRVCENCVKRNGECGSNVKPCEELTQDAELIYHNLSNILNDNNYDEIFRTIQRVMMSARERYLRMKIEVEGNTFYYILGKISMLDMLLSDLVDIEKRYTGEQNND